MAALSRAQFLRGNWQAKTAELRPPWCLPEVDFLAVCNRCEDCVTACSENILNRSGSGYPQLDFSRGACTFCGDCASACKTGALNQHLQPALKLKATITASCMTINGTSCTSCIDACEHEAIKSTPALHGRAYIRVTADLCTGCGNCIAGCPVTAITMGAVC